jgi:hypothetical protein
MKKEAHCRHYRQELARSQRRMAELEEHGVAALSRYDREIAYGGDDERAIQMSIWSVRNHIAYFTEKLSHCDEPVPQITLFDPSLTPNDPWSL